MKATHIPSAELHFASKVPGSFCFVEKPDGQVYFQHYCPCGCGGLYLLPVRTGAAQGKHWGWDGNGQEPTLTPSIKHFDRGLEPHWHGFMEEGQWRVCS